MSDGVTDSYNVCELCGDRMFGHDYVKCHKASVKCLTAMHDRIADLETENKRLRNLYSWARAIFDMARTTCKCNIRWVDCVEYIDLVYKPEQPKEQK